MKYFHLVMIPCLALAPCAAGADAMADLAGRVCGKADIHGGLLVHVGCGDGRVAAALAGEGAFVVQGLDADPARIAQTRARLRAAGRYGPVSVSHWDGRRLPYVENLVSLLVVTPETSVDKQEAMRVLRPGGAAVTLDAQQRIIDCWHKPRPEEIDDWQHYLHGPDNNAVARDAAVGPPERLQWVNGPTYARSHEINSSMAAMVSSGGRLVYIWDEGPTGMTDARFPARWSLIARDAFSGITLWKRPMPDWGWRQWHQANRWDDPRERAKMLRHLPATLPRRLVAVDDRLYVTLGYEAPVSVLHAATGKTLREIDGTAWTDEILHSDGTLFLRVRLPESPPDRDVWNALPQKQRGRVVAVDSDTGSVLWRSAADTMAPLTLAARNGRVFYTNYEQVVCLDRGGGRELWRSEPVDTGSGHRGTGGTLVAQDRVVLYAPAPAAGGNHFGQLHGYSAESGQLLWKGPTYAGPGITNPPDLFVVDGAVWTGETRLPVDNSEIELYRQGLDPLSGRVVREVIVPKLISPGHHYRCYRSKATERFLLLPKRGVEFVDLVGQEHMRHDWLRAPCIYGMLPANGLLYVAPHQCVCYPGVQLANFNALSAATPKVSEMADADDRLQHGPAWDQIDSRVQASPADWPSYRHDARRSGSTDAIVPDELDEKWRFQLGGKLTPPVVAGDRLLVADKDAHTIHALDHEHGKRVWSFTSGGRIDSPPTVHDSLVLFGSAEGWVYCLRLDDGREVWRFRAAPRDRRVVAFEQVESAWPVHGSVLVQQDPAVDPPRAVAYCTAGRSSFLDGGIHVYGLDPHTGEVLHQTVLSGPRPDPFNDVGTAGYMDGAKSDLLVSDGADLFLFQERFRSDLTRLPEPMQNMGKEGGGFRVFPSFRERGATGRRLITTSGFLDDAYNEGHYWTYSERWAGWDRKMRTVPCYGQLLCFDNQAVYGVHVFTDNIRVRRGMTLGDKGYRLFARDHDAKDDRWSHFVPLRVRAMVATGETVFVAGTPDVVPEDDPLAAVEGHRGARLWAISKADGRKQAELPKLDASPVFDGLIAAAGRLFLCTADGYVLCLGPRA